MIGRTISHYKITEKLGEGGMGVVYKAEDIRLKRPVALKFLPPEALDDKERQDRFLHEAQAAAALNHPNVCVVHEIDNADGRTFIVMEFIEGESVKDKVASRPIKLNEALGITIQVGEALKAAHAKAIVHRDVKSANIMVTAEGLGKIMDFGLAQLSERTKLTKTGSSLGTPAYMSPEQALGQKIDHRSDIWSFAVVLYEMISGQLPFKGEVEAAVAYSIVNEEPEPLTSLRVGVPVELDRIVAKALAKDPDERYQHIDEVLVDLRGVVRDSEVKQKPRPRQESVGAAASPTAAAGSQPVPAEPALPLRRVWSRSRIAAVTFVALAALGLAAWWIAQDARIGEARQMLPEISRLVDDEQLVAAYRMAEQAEQVLGDDPALAELWPRISRTISVQTEPPGADVYVKEYMDTEGAWQYLGFSPIQDVRIPLQYCRWRITNDGYEEIEVADRRSHRWRNRIDGLEFELHTAGSIPPGMVRVESDLSRIRAGVMGSLGPVELGSYDLDRHEVTNSQFKKFVDDGGYAKPEYWRQPFVKNGKVLSWEEVLQAELRDATGRPGPSTWSLGSYPDGEDDFPVQGVSWYEAAAYAEWAGKQLPTIYHWYAAVQGTWNDLVSVSNLAGSELKPAGASQAISGWGTHDMAGNVREWCWNATANERFILGGAWDDAVYIFGEAGALPPFDRSPGNGFRCAKYEKTLPEELTSPVEREIRDFSTEKPVDDATFEAYKSLFSYDRTELNERVEAVDESPQHWIKEKVTFDAGYAGERVIAYLFLPREGAPPYQAVVFFPGSGAERIPSSEDLGGIRAIQPLLRSGRAVLYPVYKGTYERHPEGPNRTKVHLSFGGSIETAGPGARRDFVVMAVRDLRRSLDYLETRKDIQADRVAFCGYSLGARMSPLFLAVEDRFRAALLLSGGLMLEPDSALAPQVDEINYAPHVTVPVLMLNGRYDFIFPLDRSQIPLFQALGTPDSDKKHVLFDGGHRVSFSNAEIREIVDWLDRYLGPVGSQTAPDAGQ